MNNTRRKIVTTVPLLPLVGLAACGGGSDVASTNGDAGRAQAMAAGTVNGYGLKVAKSLTLYTGILEWTTYYADTIWTDSPELNYIVPASTMPGDTVALCNGCLTGPKVNGAIATSGATLFLLMTEEVSGYRRAVSLKLKLGGTPLNPSFDLSKLAAGDASVVVNSASGSHYEYFLTKGTVSLVTWDTTAKRAVVRFSSVQGWPAPKGTVPGNSAGSPMALSGDLFSTFLVENATWMV